MRRDGGIAVPVGARPARRRGLRASVATALAASVVSAGLAVGPSAAAHGATSTPIGAGTTVVDLDVTSPLVDPSTVGGTLDPSGRPLRIRVMLPAGYSANPTRRYPVLYLLQGATGSYTQFTDNFDVAALTQRQPTIVVMPDAGTYGMYTNWYNQTQFGSPKWADFHLQVMLPLIEKRFRIMAGRSWHTIAGLSMGGQGTLRYASFLPSYFGTAIGMSPAMPDMQNPTIPPEFAAVMTKGLGTPVTYDDLWGPVTGEYAAAYNPTNLISNLQYTKVFVASGDGTPCPGDPVDTGTPVDLGTESQIRPQVVAYANKLSAAGIDVTERLTCGGHTYPVWTRDLQDISQNFGFFHSVPNNPTTWTYTTGLTHGTMWQFAFTTSTEPTSLLSITRTGRMLSGAGSGLGTGTITLTESGCRIVTTVPFSRTLPAQCH